MVVFCSLSIDGGVNCVADSLAGSRSISLEYPARVARDRPWLSSDPRLMILRILPTMDSGLQPLNMGRIVGRHAAMTATHDSGMVQ